ncbi:MAG: glycosyltransferase family 4 protein [Planctomycetota bacterium]
MCFTQIPWVASFEMEYPRYLGPVRRQAIDAAYEMMARDACRLLLPMSQAAKSYFLRRVPDHLVSVIEPKVHVFSGGVSVPPGALCARERYLQDSRSEFRVGFVGNDFWRKGGPALLRAAGTLRRRSCNIRLIIISALQPRTYVTDIDEGAYAHVVRTLQQSEWIELYSGLPNEEVLTRLAACDAFALPTLDESFGWAIVEAKALGLPVITTNIFALPELARHGSNAYVIRVPLDADHRWDGSPWHGLQSSRAYEQAMTLLGDGVVDALETLMNQPGLPARLGSNARRHFLAEYAEDIAAHRLAALLHSAFQIEKDVAHSS